MTQVRESEVKEAHRKPSNEDFSPEFLLECYERMVTIRDFEERVHDEFAGGDIPGFVHLYAGEEASAVGICSHLTNRDAIASTHRGHGHCIAKGCDVGAMMKEIYGKRGGLCGGKGGSMHIADLSKGMMGANGIVGGGPPLVCGAALTAKYLKTGGVAIAFVGDGGSNQGTTLESYNLAKVWNLPVVFVVEDNGYAEATSSEWSVAGSQIGRAQGFGMIGLEVDGFDFFSVYDAARDAIDRARKGLGPSLLHVKLKRFFGHFEGDAMTYRADGEVDRIRAENDSLKIFRRRATEAKLLNDSDLDAVEARVARLIDEAVAAAEADEFPKDSDLLTDVYISY